MGRLEGKSVIITGAGSGIGRAASLLFAREGSKLVIVDRAEGVKETAKLVSDAGGTVEAVMADAGSEADVKAFIDKAVSKYGRLDAIWANAGVSGGLVRARGENKRTLHYAASRNHEDTKTTEMHEEERFVQKESSCSSLVFVPSWSRQLIAVPRRRRRPPARCR